MIMASCVVYTMAVFVTAHNVEDISLAKCFEDNLLDSLFEKKVCVSEHRQTNITHRTHQICLQILGKMQLRMCGLFF